MRTRGFKTYLAVAALCLTALLGIFAAFAATRPDRDVVFVREVPTNLPPETLKLSMDSVSNWPQWFFNVAKAERVDIMDRPFPQSQQVAATGALIRLDIHPHKGERRGSFDLLVQLSEYEPGKRIVMELVRDQSGRIQRLFDHLVWKIEVIGAAGAGGKPAFVRGTETAHTRHWRARMVAAFSERILMNQLFYPDVMGLAEFTQPRAPNPFPAYGQ